MHRLWFWAHKIKARVFKWISKIVFKFGWMKCKWVYPNRFLKYIQMQNRCMNCRGDKFQHHWLVHFDLCTLASSAVVVNKSQKNQLICFYWPLLNKLWNLWPSASKVCSVIMCVEAAHKQHKGPTCCSCFRNLASHLESIHHWLKILLDIGNNLTLIKHTAFGNVSKILPKAWVTHLFVHLCSVYCNPDKITGLQDSKTKCLWKEDSVKHG